MRPVRAGDCDDRTQSETEARILDAALTAVGRRGVRRLTVGSVCAQAGVSRATLYRYFTSKDELLEAVGRRAVNGRSGGPGAGRRRAARLAPAAEACG
jgi:AcrR family transcriptional regulator